MSTGNQFQKDAYFVQAGEALAEQKKKERERLERKRKKENPTAHEYLFEKRSVSDLPLPAADSDVAIGLYILFVPYITGLLFLYFHLFGMDFGRMYALREQHSFILIWLIGYEVVAGLALAWIFKSILFSLFRSQPEVQKNRHGH